MLFLTMMLAATQAAAPGDTGITFSAGKMIARRPETFDLGGFRLGMSEPQVEQVLRARGMTVKVRTRTKAFDGQVRELARLKGAQVAASGSTALDSAEIDDGQGGKIYIKMLAWPTGASVQSIAYLPPASTTPAGWQKILSDKYGPWSRDTGTIGLNGLHASWCGMPTCSGRGDLFRLVADVNEGGGSLVLSQPEGTAGRATALIERAAADMMPRRAPAP